jgi:putative SOS response-associated peptidase YedK
LVIVDWFYEWKGERGNKQPYRVKRSDAELSTYDGLWWT